MLSHTNVPSAGLPLQVYDELHRLARRYLARQRGDMLQATDLVHEAYLQLADPQATWPAATRSGDGHQECDKNQDCDQIVAAGARIMRRFLARRSRRQHQIRRAEVRPRDPEPAAAVDLTEQLTLTAALEKLARHDQRRAWIVRLRSLVGLETREIASLLEVAPRTVEREWNAARAWLQGELSATIN